MMGNAKHRVRLSRCSTGRVESTNVSTYIDQTMRIFVDDYRYGPDPKGRGPGGKGDESKRIFISGAADLTGLRQPGLSCRIIFFPLLEYNPVTFTILMTSQLSASMEEPFWGALSNAYCNEMVTWARQQA